MLINNVYVNSVIILFMLFFSGIGIIDYSPVSQRPSVLKYYAGDAAFLFKHGDSFVGNGTYLDRVRVVVDYRFVNESFALVYVNISAKYLYWDPSYHIVFHSINNVEQSTGGDIIKIIGENYHLYLKFLVNTTNNYAWLNGKFIGFFPLYFFRALGYNNVTKYTYVYLGKELHVDLIQGKPKPANYHLWKNLTLTTLHIYNEYISIHFIYHYPVVIEGILPIGNNTYLYCFHLGITGDWIPYLKSIDDYPYAVTYINWDRPVVVVGVFASIIALAIMLIKRRRRG